MAKIVFACAGREQRQKICRLWCRAQETVDEAGMQVHDLQKNLGGRKVEWMRRFWNLAGQMFGPLLLYEMTIWLVLEGWSLISEADPTAGAILPLTALAAGLTAVEIRLWYRNKTERKEERGRKSVFWILLAGFGTCLCLNHVLMLLPIPKTGYQSTSELLYQPALWMQVVCTGIVIPFTEELIFRGMAYESLRRELPFAGAAVISAVYFGLFHGNLIQGIYAGLVGIFLAGVYEQGGLRDAWLFHATANLTAIFLTAAGLDQRILSDFGIAATATAGGILAAAAFYQMGRRNRENQK